MQGKEPVFGLFAAIFHGNAGQYKIYFREADLPNPRKSRPQNSEKNQAVSHAYLIVLVLLLALAGSIFWNHFADRWHGSLSLFCGSHQPGVFFRKNKDTFSPLSEKWQHGRSRRRCGLVFCSRHRPAGSCFWFFQDNRFTLLNVSLWLAGIILFILAVWENPQRS
jgi:hypothetical protein